MRRGIVTGLVLIPLAVSLAGCGYDRGDRAVSGGLLGAGGGAAIAAVTGGSPLVGAAIGGGAGAIGGALTSGRDINLGRPIWRWGSASTPQLRRDLCRWWNGVATAVTWLGIAQIVIPSLIGDLLLYTGADLN
jgi:osmotically inducible lipoprotein OsmB